MLPPGKWTFSRLWLCVENVEIFIIGSSWWYACSVARVSHEYHRSYWISHLTCISVLLYSMYQNSVWDPIRRHSCVALGKVTSPLRTWDRSSEWFRIQKIKINFTHQLLVELRSCQIRDSTVWKGSYIPLTASRDTSKHFFFCPYSLSCLLPLPQHLLRRLDINIVAPTLIIKRSMFWGKWKISRNCL